MLKTILVINGPNLNSLGRREPSLYGSASYADLEKYIHESGAALDLKVSVCQSNHEGQMVEWIQSASSFDGLLINPAAYGHTSVALLDALLALERPSVEVHITQIYKREPFRHKSYVSQAVSATICGAGFLGYRLGLMALKEMA